MLPEAFTKLVLENLSQAMHEHPGLPALVAERAKFEGWLKVELCGVLAPYGKLIPEWKRYDLLFDDWVMELKTFCTNYQDARIVDKDYPIKENIEELLVQIGHLKKSGLPHQAVIFVAFPLDNPTHITWAGHLQKITDVVTTLKSQSFVFSNGVPGILYVGVL